MLFAALIRELAPLPHVIAGALAIVGVFLLVMTYRALYKSLLPLATRRMLAGSFLYFARLRVGRGG